MEVDHWNLLPELCPVSVASHTQRDSMSVTGGFTVKEPYTRGSCVRISDYFKVHLESLLESENSKL